MVYECRTFSFKNENNDKLTTWKSTGIDNFSVDSDLKSIPDAISLLPNLDNNDRMNVKFSGNYFVQNKILHPNNNNVVNIYIVYKLDPISFSRNTDYTIQNALFGAIDIVENSSGSSKNEYEGYGICFDEDGSFTSGNITNGKNVLVFDADMSFSYHSTNKANNIYVLGKILCKKLMEQHFMQKKFTKLTLQNQIKNLY